jgi:phage gp36-like protein
MPYTSQAEIETLIPRPILITAMDDDRDGQMDEGLLDALITAASNAVDAYLASLYPVPFGSPTPAIRESALVFAAEMVLARRLAPTEKNPFAARADMWRERLSQIGAGKLPLDAAETKTHTPGAVITSPMDLDCSLR